MRETATRASRTRRFRTRAVCCVALLGLASVSATLPLVSSSIKGSERAEINTQACESISDCHPLQGITYALAEVECRQWHRNRAFRPYNFALRQ